MYTLNSSELLEQLQTNGVWYANNFLSSRDVKHFVHLARQLPYEAQPQVYGERKVRQDVESIYLHKHPAVRAVWEDGLIRPVTDAVHTALEGHLEQNLYFNEVAIQRYPNASHGIDRHRDESTNRNVIVLVGLDGEGLFSVYPDLKEETPHEQILLRPRGILIMVTPGFLPTGNLRPFHGVQRIVGGKDGYRYMLGFRQTQSAAKEEA